MAADAITMAMAMAVAALHSRLCGRGAGDDGDGDGWRAIKVRVGKAVGAPRESPWF